MIIFIRIRTNEGEIMNKKCIIGKINEISSNANKFISKRIKEKGLPILQNHIPLFYILPEDGSALLFNEISNIWEISKSSLSDIINRYENIGLIKKCMCSEDKRSVYISLTKEAIDIKRALENMEAEFLDLALCNFDNNERQTFEENIDKCLINVEKML